LKAAGIKTVSIKLPTPKPASISDPFSIDKAIIFATICKKALVKNYSHAIIFIFLFCNNTFSQTDTALKYAETITAAELKQQLTIIASAEMEGRETATEGQRKAADYIESQFKQTGLATSRSISGYQQYYPLYKDTLIPKIFKIGKKSYRFGTDYTVTPGSSDNSQFSSKNIVFSGYGIADKDYDDYAGKNVKGKVVLVFAGEPKAGGKYIVTGSIKRSAWSYNNNKKAIMAKLKGAVALLMVHAATEDPTSLPATNSKKSNIYFASEKDSSSEKIPVVTVTAGVLKDIFGEEQASILTAAAKEEASLQNFKAERTVKSKLAYRKKKIESAASNVIGFIEGTDKKNEYVFLTAHYDHLGKKGNVIYFGADDDGSGTVSVIEMAKAFEKAKADGFGPRRTVVFMTVSGEEEGLWGSEYYSDHPLFPLDSTTVDLNTDMIGRIDPGRKNGDSTNYIYIIGDDKLSTDLQPVSSRVNSTYTKLELDHKFNDPDDPEKIFFRSDHYNFARKGVPVLFFFDGIHNDYHMPTDTVDKINFNLMEKRARFIFLIAWEMANRNNMLKRDLPLPVENR
jgi:Zn-dependent M28 family amino/carboxypeptidase